MATNHQHQVWHVPKPASSDDFSINGTPDDSFSTNDSPSWTLDVSRRPRVRIVHVYGHADKGNRAHEILTWIQAGALLPVMGVIVLLILGVPLPAILRLIADAVDRLSSSWR